MANVSLRNVGKSYGNIHIAKDVNLDISEGEFVVFVGPSGCGKSTLLRMIAGLEDITIGDLYIGEQ
ncbi:ABC transporter ATP-binding protein [Rodentibacter caecimuris]|uniref:ABC transporter ATP-binding protein n=1 Tax=Rodentibacter caecimuris TaxID=1796644 RepID=A0ABX3KYM2_9PAST|nr:ABC transporter ATP-binding protein [Rodentibacter heylii]